MELFESDNYFGVLGAGEVFLFIFTEYPLGWTIVRYSDVGISPVSPSPEKVLDQACSLDCGLKHLA